MAISDHDHLGWAGPSMVMSNHHHGPGQASRWHLPGVSRLALIFELQALLWCCVVIVIIPVQYLIESKKTPRIETPMRLESPVPHPEVIMVVVGLFVLVVGVLNL